MRLVLWDIDGTLVHAGTSGVTAVRTAFAALTGRTLTGPVVFDGQSELAFFRDLFERRGIVPDTALLAAVPAAMAAAMATLGPDMVRTGHALPGAGAAIAHLASVPGVRQSVLTGNVRPNAELKLRTFGLADAVDFEIGAYGSDAEDRADLVPYALGRANARFGGYTAADVVLIGDTPRDVAAGRAHGVRVVGVGTGAYGIEHLRSLGADAVLADLTDVAALRAAVGV
jgi:phosphoglycolate phosphatase-like HAD superfamily hydrolase